MTNFQKTLCALVVCLTVSAVAPYDTARADWAMAGANPERTSWVPETLPDDVKTTWVKPLEPYVSQHTQVVGAEGKVYVSTARGLYAFDANSGSQAWVYATALPLGNSPTYANGILYVGGLDKKIHAVNASNGSAVWTYTATGGFSTNPVVANGKVYAGSRDGAFYAINTSDGSLAWRYQTGNQIMQSAAFKAENDGVASTTQGTLYFASNDGYAYALNAQNGSVVWKSSDKLPSLGFAWWPVIYGDDVIFTRSSFYASNGPEAAWLFGSSPSTNMFVGTTSFESQSGYWPVGEKIVDVRTNPNGFTFPDYFETQEAGDTRPQHGPYRRNAFFFNRVSGVERQFDLDNDGKTDGAPVSFTGDGGTHPPPVVSGQNNVLYFNSVVRGRNSSFSGMSIFGWKVGTPFLSITMDGFHSSDEPMGITGAGDKLYLNHCCDRDISGVNISRPNTDTPGEGREFTYISGGGLSYFAWPLDLTGLPNTPDNYYYKEAVKYFWNPQPALAPPCCAAVFWNENDKVGPSAYNGKLYVIMGNALIALGAGGAGTTAPRLPSATFAPEPSYSSTVSDTEIKNRLEQEVGEIVAAGHLKPSYMHGGLLTTGSNSRAIDDYLNQYWHNPADIQLVLLRALPFITNTSQNQNLKDRVKAYLQSEFANYSPATYAHTGFDNGVARDPWPYPPYDTVSRLFNPPATKQTSSNFNNVWSFPPHNVYAIWKYAQAGLGNPATLLSQWGTRVRAPITANNATLTDDYLSDHPLVTNAYIAAYKGYVELAKMAGHTQAQYGPYESELNRLLAMRVQRLTTFPDSQNSAAGSYRGYYPSMITYYNFAYMTPELGEYLNTRGRSSDPNKDIMAILQKYQSIAPYWMQAQNYETQGETAIQPYQQTHALFQGLAQVKKASRDELIKYLDTPIVPVGDLYYIDNLAAILEASARSGGGSGSTLTGDIDSDRDVDIYDYSAFVARFGTNDQVADFNRSGTVDVYDYNSLMSNFGARQP